VKSNTSVGQADTPVQSVSSAPSTSPAAQSSVPPIVSTAAPAHTSSFSARDSSISAVHSAPAVTPVLDLLGDFASSAQSHHNASRADNVGALATSTATSQELSASSNTDSAVPLGIGDWLQVRRSGKTFYYRYLAH
jgi:hypothetical protein